MEEGTRQAAGNGPADPAGSEEGLAERFRARLVVFAARRVDSRQSAEDVAQEVLSRVVQALRAGRLRDPEALGGFVFQTARNVCLHRARKSGREGRALGTIADSPADAPTDDPLLTLVDRERHREVRRALHRLSSEDRDLLRGLYWEGLGYDELAGRTGATPQALRVRKHRALRRLSALLTAGSGETNDADREPGKR